VLPCKKKVTGTWTLTAEISSENLCATHSSLKEIKINNKKALTLNRGSTFISNLSLCNEWNVNGIYIFPKEFIISKKNKNPDELFWIECTGMYPDHYFLSKNKKIKLYNPSVAGYAFKYLKRADQIRIKLTIHYTNTSLKTSRSNLPKI
jgi:hypothetical protein